MKRLLLLSVVILGLCLQSPAFARSKLYHYDGDIPMITFMLNMMVAMGLLDKVPPAYLNRLPGRYPYSSTGPWRNNLGKYGMYSGKTPWKYGGLSPWNRFGSSWDEMQWDGWDRPTDHPYLQHGNQSRFSCDEAGCYRYSALDGIWMSSGGEILGIRADRLVWSDGDEAYAVGIISTTPEHIYARLNGASTSTPYSYSLAGNQLNLRDSDGSVRRFYRLPGSNRPR